MSDNNNGVIYEDNHILFSPEPHNYLSLHFFSIWNTKRNNKYITLKDRPTEPNLLFAFIRTHSGVGNILTRHGIITLPPASLVLLDVSEIIEYSPNEGIWEYTWYNFTPFTGVPFFKKNKVYNVPISNDEKYLNKNIFALDYTEEMAYTLATTIFLQLIYRWIYSVKHIISENPSTHSADLNKAIAYINNNLEQKIKISDLAKLCCISENQFRILFKKRLGVSPKTYIYTQRLSKIAYFLITTNYSISELAVKFDFANPYLLSREFKKVYGISPLKYRKTPLNSLPVIK